MIVGGTRAGKTTMTLALLEESLRTHSWVMVATKHGFVRVPGKVVPGQVVTDSGELESGAREAGADDPV